MIKGVFLDFYGTVVYEDGEVIDIVTKDIINTAATATNSEIDRYWWNEFQSAFMNAYGDSFKSQRELELQSLEKTIRHFKSEADAEKLSSMMFEYWRKPPIFDESKEFFETCPVPVFIVSNIDRSDILSAINYHGLNPAGVFTSEDAKAYKPRKELFELALQKTGLKPDEVIHIGDSLNSDIKGAMSVGIKGIWVNRSGKEVPKDVTSVSNLLEILNCMYE